MPEVSQDEPAILEIEVPADMDASMALTVLAWCDRLVHELVLPDHPIREYRLVRSWHPEELLIKLWVGEAEPWPPPPKERRKRNDGYEGKETEGAPAGAAAPRSMACLVPGSKSGSKSASKPSQAPPGDVTPDAPSIPSLADAAPPFP